MSAFGSDRVRLAAVVALTLLPFASKPLHIDDPMYLWAAQQIAAHPLDFYGFDVNWYGTFEPMYQLNKNPPLVSFWLAAAGALFGWGEIALHLAMIPLAIAAALGTYALATRLCQSPLLAAAVAWLTPVTIVSATTLMSDVLLLTFWVWAVFLWLRALETGRRRDWLLAGLAIGLAPLAKYFGIALLPLLAAYALARERRMGVWAVALLVPLLLVAAYEAYMIASYGHDPLLDVGRYALEYDSKGRFHPGERVLVGLCFVGGGALTTAFFAPWLWPRRYLWPGLLAWMIATAALPALGVLGDLPLREDGAVRWGLVLQVALLAGAGIQLLALAVAELVRTRDAAGLLLLLWVGGVWVFCSFANWTPTARAILPLVPAAGILVARRIEARSEGRSADGRALLRLPLLAGLAAALCIAYADVRLAESARTAAQQLSEQYTPEGRRLYFQGAWGFQHYMQGLGVERLDLHTTVLEPGDRIATPRVGSNLVQFPEEIAAPIAREEFATTPFAATMSKAQGAGFYAALWGPLPFVFGPIEPERYDVLELRRRLKLTR